MVRWTAWCLLAFSVANVAALGQGCGPNQVFLKNDSLPANPGTQSVSVIQGLCEGEAAGCVFDVSSVGSQVKVNLAAIGFINVVSAAGIQAAGNLRIYDGITYSGTIPVLGPLVFDFNMASGAGLGFVSSGINTVDISQFNVMITSGTLVVTFAMDFNPQGGTCPTGYQTNFATDNSSPFGGACNQFKNLIYISGQGWRDPAVATVSGVPLCPLFYAGDWLIRACVEPVQGPSNLTIAFPLGTAVVTPATVFVLFNAPTNIGDSYFATPSFSLGAPGSGFPVNPVDPLVQARVLDPVSLAPFLFGFDGIIGAAGNAGGQINFPALSLASPLNLYFGFITYNGTGLTGISQSATLAVQ